MNQCIVARLDRQPLTREAIETIWKFHAKLIESFGYSPDEGWASTQDLMTPGSFQLFCREYYKEQRKAGRAGFDSLYKPL